MLQRDRAVSSGGAGTAEGWTVARLALAYASIMKGTVIRHVPDEAATRAMVDPIFKAIKAAVTEDYGQERGRATLAKVAERITEIDWAKIRVSVGQTEVVLPAWRRDRPHA
jgi:hypothetical protein